MVKYACKIPTALVYEHTAVRKALPKRMPRVACLRQSKECVGVCLRFCSMGFNSPYIAGSNPAVRQKRIASGLVLSFGTQKERYTKAKLDRVRERFLF